MAIDKPTPEQIINRSKISFDDFKECLAFLRALNEPDIDGSPFSRTKKRALLIAAVVAYARPFTANRKGFRNNTAPSLERSAIETLSEDMRVLHEKLIALRNRVVAHSDADAKPTSYRPGVNGPIFWGRAPDIIEEGIEVEKFSALAERMKRWCLGRFTCLDDQIRTQR